MYIYKFRKNNILICRLEKLLVQTESLNAFFKSQMVGLLARTIQK